MNIPYPAKTYPPVDPRLGIKSSVPNLKSAIALLLLIWESSKHAAEVSYSHLRDGDGTEDKRIVISDNVFEGLWNYVHRHTDMSRENFLSMVNENSLIKGQIEHLQVAFSYVFRLAQIEQIVKKSERTGKIRSPKKIRYTTNVEIISLVSQGEEYIATLLAWLGVSAILPSGEVEIKLRKMLTIFAENAIYKQKTENGEDCIFNLHGVFRMLSEVDSSVDITGIEETKGPLRILKAAIKDNLIDGIQDDDNGGGRVKIRDGSSKQVLKEFAALMDAYLEVNQSAASSSKMKESLWQNGSLLKTEYKRNRIIFGAPGTGKSYLLNSDASKLLKDTEVKAVRVTFHPEYSYFNFVGSYKPVMLPSCDPDDPKIGYKFVPGPFTEVLVNALRDCQADTKRPHLLIIEEINRARVASVFGDIFQLLDRNAEGFSEYEIQTSLELRDYLKEQLGVDMPTLSLPDNLFIWATMNSADQGVFPMDTAFKRRWSFEYIGIDENDGNMEIELALPSGVVTWNQVRKAINAHLEEHGINEDKLIGPHFIPKSAFGLNENGQVNDINDFITIFKDKVIMYIFDDAARHVRRKIFAGVSNVRYSEICKMFDQKGLQIFGGSFIVDDSDE